MEEGLRNEIKRIQFHRRQKNSPFHFSSFNSYYFNFALIFGVRLSVQFSGGTIITYTYEGEIDADSIQTEAQEVIGQNLSVNMKAGINGLDSFEIVLDEKEGLVSDVQAELDTALSEKFSENNVTFLSNSTVSPSIGSEFFIKSLVAIGFAAVLIVIYVAFRFKKSVAGQQV